MAPKSAVKRKDAAASQIAALARKKQRTSCESLRADIERFTTARSGEHWRVLALLDQFLPLKLRDKVHLVANRVLACFQHL